MDSFFGYGNMTAEEAKLEAQKLAFAPFAFQATRILRDRNILKFIEEGNDEGKTFDDIKENVRMNEYGISILLDAGESIGLLKKNGSKWILTNTGYYVLNDKITNVNMNLAVDVCYQGMFYLEKSIDNSKPEGLKVFGEWETVYDALSSLPEKTKNSWYAFDHCFSDLTFPKVLPLVLKNKPKRLLDIGGNTGKWALKCALYDDDVRITILDLPGQIKEAEENIRLTGSQERINCIAIDLLDRDKEFPDGYDAVWMSQFLDCFQPDDIVSILLRAKRSLNEKGVIYIMETFVDKQRFRTAKYCLDMTSLYFTAIANGKSRMYHYDDMIKFIKQAGLDVIEVIEHIGISHTIIKVGVH
jgi:ubiquinone/menaquinone biosynthesis C-methylase UbiE